MPKKKAIQLPGKVKKPETVMASDIKSYKKAKEPSNSGVKKEVKGRNFVHTAKSKKRFERELAEQNEKIMKRFLRAGGFTGKVPRTKVIDELIKLIEKRIEKAELNGRPSHAVRTGMNKEEHNKISKNLTSRVKWINKELEKYSEMYYLKNKIDYKFFSEKRTELLAELGAAREYLNVLEKHKKFLTGESMPNKQEAQKAINSFILDLKRLDKLGLVPGGLAGVGIRQSP